MVVVEVGDRGGGGVWGGGCGAGDGGYDGGDVVWLYDTLHMHLAFQIKHIPSHSAAKAVPEKSVLRQPPGHGGARRHTHTHAHTHTHTFTCVHGVIVVCYTVARTLVAPATPAQPCPYIDMY